jgi:thiol-disulfide isomerase/thioredoxin
MTLLAAACILSACGGSGDGDKGKAAQPQATAAGEAVSAAPPGRAISADGASAPTNSAAPAAAPVKPGEIDRTHAGTKAPDAAFMQRNGVSRHMSDFAGRPVLVNLWATWCAPCVAEMPALDRMSLQAKEVAVLPVSQDLAGWSAVDRFFTPGKFQALVPYLDQPNAFALAVGARGLPMSILYDEEGREVWRVAGPLEWDTPEVIAMVRDAS